MPPSNLLSALLDLVRAAAREDSSHALDPGDAPATRSAPLLSMSERSPTRSAPPRTPSLDCAASGASAWCS
jgi:hypothetical protein